MNSSLSRPYSLSSSDRLAAAIAHAGTWFGWFLVPLIVYILRKEDSRYVAFHAMQSLLWSALGTILALASCGLAIPVFLVFHIIAAAKVFSGEEYEYPWIANTARRLVDET